MNNASPWRNVTDICIPYDIEWAIRTLGSSGTLL
jgi:hypothetical protein